MIHAVICSNQDDRDTAVAAYKAQGLKANWYGSDAVVRAELCSGSNITGCATCAAGPGAFLVVAFPSGEGPN